MARVDSDPASKCAKYLHNINDEHAKVDDVVKNVASAGLDRTEVKLEHEQEHVLHAVLWFFMVLI
jgi:hypothetical protein